MRLHLAGHYWDYSEPRRIMWEGQPVDGLCVAEPKRQIKVCRKLRGKQRAETQLHELAHAACFSSSETWVTTFAASGAALCYLAGVGHVRRGGDRAAGAAVIRQVLFHCLQLARTDLDNAELLQDWADDLTRCLVRLGWATFTP